LISPGLTLRGASIFILICILTTGFGCSEKVASDLGFNLLPQDMVGGLPVQKEFKQVLESATVPGASANKGGQARVYVGRLGDYRMRTLLGFRVSLPPGTVVQSAELNLYVISLKGELPLRLSVYLLERVFKESEVTYELAAAGEPWSTPGGDFGSEPLGETLFEGNRIDTVTVTLDPEAVNNRLAYGDSTLPLIILGEEQEAVLGLIAWESVPTQPVASRLDLIFTIPGETTYSLLERRAFMDATITSFEGVTGSGVLRVGEVPASQIFFAYDFSELPPLATVNQALLHLWVAGGTIVDSFLVGAYTADELAYVSADEPVLGRPTLVVEGDSLLVVDVTRAVQRLVTGGTSGAGSRYLVISSLSSANVAGFVEFYPPESPDSLRHPYLSLTYTDIPSTGKPGK